ncbi:Glycosyl transferases group 1 [Candidatus Fervidibacteria bacterium JGI MDM2 JNZ-1-D12]
MKRLQLPRSQVIYYGVPDPLDGKPAERERSAIRCPLTFAYVGRLVSEKGLPLLLETAWKLKCEGYRFHLQFIGDGPERSSLEVLTEKMGLADIVQFTRSLRGEALSQTMDTVDVVVMPSVWEETVGLAAIEQMMRGRLVIASDIGGLGEVVGDARLKFPPGDVNGLASCLRRVLQRPEIVGEFGRKARQRALQLFRQERMVDEHLSIYRRHANKS